MTSRGDNSRPSIVSNMLLGPYLVLQQAQLLESASWMVADLPAVVLCYRVRVSDKPVLEQLKRLLETISQWCEGHKVCASSTQLLGLWLDKLFRRDIALVPEQEHKLKIMSLSTCKARCLGRLAPEVVGWLKEHNAGGSLDIDRLSETNCVLQALSAFRQSRDFAQSVELLMAHGFMD